MPRRAVRTPYDAWSKRALRRWLGELGDVQVDVHVQGEARRGDVYFIERLGRRKHRTLGALDDVAHGHVLFEHCWNPLSLEELDSCLVKRIELDAEEARTARRERRPRSSVRRTTLCLIFPSLSARLATETGAKRMPSLPRGFLTLAPFLRVVFVVTNRLPRIPETLWLRLLGRDRVFLDAIDDLKRGRVPTSLRGDTLKLLMAWHADLPREEELNEEEREMRMTFERWERKLKAEGKAEGEAKGMAKSVVSFLEGRRIPLTAPQRARVLACTDSAVLRAWVRAAGTVESAADLLSIRRPMPRAVRRASSRKAV